MRARVKINKHAVGKTQTQQVVILKGGKWVGKGVPCGWGGCKLGVVATNWFAFFPRASCSEFPNISCGARPTSQNKNETQKEQPQQKTEKVSIAKVK